MYVEFNSTLRGTMFVILGGLRTLCIKHAPLSLEALGAPHATRVPSPERLVENPNLSLSTKVIGKPKLIHVLSPGLHP